MTSLKALQSSSVNSLVTSKGSTTGASDYAAYALPSQALKTWHIEKVIYPVKTHREKYKNFMCKNKAEYFQLIDSTFWAVENLSRLPYWTGLAKWTLQWETLQIYWLNSRTLSKLEQWKDWLFFFTVVICYLYKKVLLQQGKPNHRLYLSRGYSLHLLSHCNASGIGLSAHLPWKYYQGVMEYRQHNI